jgi:uncharacterized protein
MDIIEDAEQLREVYGTPSERSLKKQLSRFDKHCRAFIERSPFLVMPRPILRGAVTHRPRATCLALSGCSTTGRC